MKSHWISVGPKSHAWYTYKKRRGHRETNKENGHVKRETGMRVIQIKAKNCQEFLGDTRS